MLALLLLGSALAGDTFVQLQADTAVTLADGAVDERAKVLIDDPLNKKWSVSVFTLVTPNYGELILGPTLHVNDFALTVSIGIETAEMPLRGEFSLYWAHRHLEVLISAETGGSGPWYVSFVKEHIGCLTVGILTQRFDGIGPRIGLATDRSEFWISPMYDYEDGAFNILAGLSWTP
ncbi:MAG: hypothetical protein WC802_02570 [Patescibacteria group bacterium]|jgi:hypothetical protein